MVATAVPDVPRDDLFRMVSRDFGVDGNTLVGYAAVFNTPTRIDSWEGRFDETVAPSAFTKTLQDRADQIKVLFNHGLDPSIGEMPLGKPAVMREDQHGLWVEVPLSDTSYNRDLKALLTDGAISGMSFRFSVKRDEWDETRDVPLRTLREVKLYEFGPVTFPAYEATTAGIRSRAAYRVWLKDHEPHNGDAAYPGTSPTPTDTPPPGHLSQTTRKHRSRLWTATFKELL